MRIVGVLFRILFISKLEIEHVDMLHNVCLVIGYV